MEKNHKTSQSSCCCCVLFSVRKREIIIAGLMVVLTCLSFDISTNYSLNYVFLTIYDLSPRLSLHLIPNRKPSLWQPSSVYYHCSVTPGCYPTVHFLLWGLKGAFVHLYQTSWCYLNQRLLSDVDVSLEKENRILEVYINRACYRSTVSLHTCSIYSGRPIPAKWRPLASCRLDLLRRLYYCERWGIC